jgi:hypothetical protein
MPPDYEELEFTIEDERWNEYELADGCRIKGRVFLAKLIRDPNNPNNMSIEQSIPVWIVYAPPHMRGEPSKYNPQELQNIPKYPVRINTSNEPWNVYRITRTGQKIKIKLEIDEVYRYTDLFDARRLPIYHVPNAIAMNLSKQEPKKGQ